MLLFFGALTLFSYVVSYGPLYLFGGLLLIILLLGSAASFFSKPGDEMIEGLEVGLVGTFFALIWSVIIAIIFSVIQNYINFLSSSWNIEVPLESLGAITTFPEQVFAVVSVVCGWVIWFLNEVWNFVVAFVNLFLPEALTADSFKAWVDGLPSIFDFRLDIPWLEEINFENRWANAVGNLLIPIVAGIFVRILWSFRPKFLRR